MDWEELISNTPLVIAGPCSAESEIQVDQSCTPLGDSAKVHLLRAGIWKPRTRPNSFEGLGKEALPWLVKTGKKLNLPTCIEVATPEHVSLALDAGVDILWIGARTTVNPFSVQAIADALKGSDVPVMIKNPINPDLQLWVGAVERIKKAGISRIATIHRGFSFYGESNYRNKPMWEIAIAMKTWFPEIPMICDPSHICGRRDTIEEVSQRALDLGFSGLMIESHVDPDSALSDAKQQLKPKDLIELLGRLKYKSSNLDDPLLIDRLSELREKIDAIDHEIIRLLASRMDVAADIGEHKRQNDITILQIERWKEILETRGKLGRTLNLSESFVSSFLEHVHKESIRTQSNIGDDVNSTENEILW